MQFNHVLQTEDLFLCATFVIYVDNSFLIPIVCNAIEYSALILLYLV